MDGSPSFRVIDERGPIITSPGEAAAMAAIHRALRFTRKDGELNEFFICQMQA
jgi:hypothetical protein